LERSPVGVDAPRRRGRPRNRDLDAKILDAARSVLSDDGIRGFSLLEVARRAGVPKSTVYRRWRTDDLRGRRETLGELGFQTRHDQELGRVVQATIERRRHACHPIFERALARGELRAGIDFEVALDLVIGPVWSRVITHRLGPKAADEIVDGALDGFGATTPPSR
jgi:AcrR family transcriptional regulator